MMNDTCQSIIMSFDSTANSSLSIPLFVITVMLWSSCNKCATAPFETPCELAPRLYYFGSWFIHDDSLSLSIPPAVVRWRKFECGLVVTQVPDKTRIGNIAALTYFPSDTIDLYEMSEHYNEWQIEYLLTDANIASSYNMDTAYWFVVIEPSIQRYGPYRKLDDVLSHCR